MRRSLGILQQHPFHVLSNLISLALVIGHPRMKYDSKVSVNPFFVWFGINKTLSFESL